jgi:hypothetical protein
MAILKNKILRLEKYLSKYWTEIGGKLDGVSFEYDEEDENVVLQDKSTPFQVYISISSKATNININVTNGYYDSDAVAVRVRWMTIDDMYEWVTAQANNEQSKWDVLM